MLSNDEPYERVFQNSRLGGSRLVLFASYPDVTSIFLRLAVGTLLMIHGYPKFTASAAGKSWMRSMGMSLAIVPFGGFVEFFGGLALLLGMPTPIVAALSAIWMLSTLWFSRAKLKKKHAGGYELDVTLLLLALAPALLGGGTFSIDHIIGL